MTEPTAPAFPSDHFEFQAPDGLAFETLDPARRAVINPGSPMVDEGSYKVLAEIQLGGDDDFLLLDVRESPLVGRFAFPFAGSVEGDSMALSPGVDFLLVGKGFDPANTDITDETGYKALRQGQPVTLGRTHYGDRFDYSDETSREHAEVSFDDSGKITVRDLNSTNGTRVKARSIRQVSEADYLTDLQTAGSLSDHERSVLRARLKGIRTQKARDLFGH